MTIHQICQREVDLVELDQTAREAAQRMTQRGVGTLIIVNEAKEPIGIITDRDLITRVLAGGKDPRITLIGEVMTPRPKKVGEDTPIEKALSTMRDGGFRRLPVVSRTGKLVGVVSLDDILLFLSGELGQIKQLLLAQTPTRAVVQESASVRPSHPECCSRSEA
jgi:CBS domain-containing protein